MQRAAKRKKEPNIPTEIAPAPLSLELRKGSSGASVAITGVVSITELTPLTVTVLSHSGRVTVLGSALRLTVFSGRTVEISGRIEGMELGYGRN